MKKQSLLFFASLLFSTNLLSQSCEVSVNSLKGKYTGDCKNDKAEGKGTAIGIDSYTGEFKNGYPQGQGKYIWENGSWYDGFWKNGLFEGEGTLSKISNPQSIIVSGFWKKGKYIGQYEKPYIIESITNGIIDVNLRKMHSTEPEITFNIKNITSGASNHRTLANPKTEIIGIQVIEGKFDQRVNDENSSTITNRYTLKKVTFPFYAIFTFETKTERGTLPPEKIGIKLYENSNWYIRVNIDN